MTDALPPVMLPPCAVVSPMRAAGWPPNITEALPFAMLSGGPAQVHIVPTTAAGLPPIITVGTPAGIIGPPVCGLPLPGFTIGQV